ncbi:TetR/AcrR family transcriptional regulator [Streptomyces sp. TS71-3]|uniref:TetR/AcrR family transcriptional regulator n=1 Tax=Streptomyces sp. TS71-3 TaxID=2733862 RepID=UPI001B1B1778|nr:TetR/AcrR family transcriptional regulator [Streptomyces sp. TS71-3]GHJ41682.1 TetR family transcriptional regulator [Streptomyces sp. TS71-3]
MPRRPATPRADEGRPAARELRRDAAENRARLIAAAERVFAESGTGAGLDDIARAAGVGPATLYRRFGSKDALVREVLAVFFGRLIELARRAYAEPAETCLDTYLYTVGWELAANRGFMHGMWGDLAPAELVRELEDLTGELLAKAQSGGDVTADVTVGDVAATIWALRGIAQTAGETAPDGWRRHLAHVLAGFRAPIEHTAAGLTSEQVAAAVAGQRRTG